MGPQFALNHMTVAKVSYVELLDIAASLGCVGVEVRNDLTQPLFDGMDPVDAGALARDKGLRLLNIAEIPRFNDWSADRADAALALMQTARAAGAEAIGLIPRNDNAGMNNGERQANLRVAVRELIPMLESHGLKGLIEPLGFESCALRHKQPAVDAISALDQAGTLQLVHDTFHHHLAGERDCFARYTGIVHVSGVVDPALSTPEMTDQDRILVNDADRLENLGQIRALLAAGYDGPISFEAFAPDVHAIADPVPALRASMDFIRNGLRANAA
ncbi:TIM barrel protein [Yoonia sp. SS1-5]|uniref:TIM barrel protein n=1 Tax=Yoonia rhodophyticola TaxID=3137370 RepID=A0AAN0MAF6_9RHOB